jgi:hypothetical protein
MGVVIPMRDDDERLVFLIYKKYMQNWLVTELHILSTHCLPTSLSLLSHPSISGIYHAFRERFTHREAVETVIDVDTQVCLVANY